MSATVRPRPALQGGAAPGRTSRPARAEGRQGSRRRSRHGARLRTRRRRGGAPNPARASRHRGLPDWGLRCRRPVRTGGDPNFRTQPKARRRELDLVLPATPLQRVAHHEDDHRVVRLIEATRVSCLEALEGGVPVESGETLGTDEDREPCPPVGRVSEPL